MAAAFFSFIHTHPESFLAGLLVGLAFCLAYNLLRNRVFVSLPGSTPANTLAMPLHVRRVSYRSSTRRNNDARDDQVRDTHDQDEDRDTTMAELNDSRHTASNSRPRNEPIFEVCPHPPSDYRVVRFTVGLVNTTDAGQHMLAGQPIELCFHDDFQGSSRRPLSLHFDRTYLTLYRVPPVLEAPPPPGAIVELGRVDVLPDDPQFLSMLEGQIRREIDEDTERKSRQSFAANLAETLGPEARSETIPRTSAIRRDHGAARRHRLDQPWAWGGLLSLVICMLSIALGVQRPTPPSSPTTTLPLIEHLANITLATTELCPTIFFNQERYLTIGDYPHLDMPVDKTSTLDLSWDLTRWLTSRIEEPMSWKAWRLYKSTSQDEDAARQFMNQSLWEYRGVQYDEKKILRDKVYLLFRHAESLWRAIESKIFNSWVRNQIASIMNMANRLGRFIELDPEDYMFIDQDDDSPWIPAASLPKQMPRGIRRILDSYRRQFLEDDHVSRACQAFRDCTEAKPTSAPYTQVVHPGCLFLADTDTETMVCRMRAWAVSARGRNLTWNYPYSVAYDSYLFIPDHVHDHFWPNKTDFPFLFDQVMILAQLKDTVEQVLEMAETVGEAWPKDKAIHTKEMTKWVRETKKKVSSPQNQTFWGKWKSWLGFENLDDVQDGEKMKQLRELANVHISRQLWDTVEGLRSLRIICQQIDDFSTLIDDLYTPESWILNKNETSGYVQLWKMPHPAAAQAPALWSLQTTLLKRHRMMYAYRKEHDKRQRVGRLRRGEKG